MRTSTKFISGAFILFAITLMVYNFQLRAEYLTGNYTKPYNGYTTIDIKDFDEIEINATSLMTVHINQGAYAIHQQNQGMVDPIQFKKSGRRLIVDMDFPEEPHLPVHFHRVNNDIVISCPNLSLLTTNSNTVLINGKKPKYFSWDSMDARPAYQSDVTVAGFTLDSLSVKLNGTSASLMTNKVKSLNINASAWSKVMLGIDNVIKKANLQINDYSSLSMGTLVIPQVTYKIADSASVALSGKTLKSLTKH